MITLLIKDTVPLGDHLILRGISESLCLAIGSWWTLTHLNKPLHMKYALLALYAMTLLFTTLQSREPVQVFLQVLSLMSVGIFFIAFVENRSEDVGVHQQVFRVAVYVLILVCLGSLILYKVAPKSAIDQTMGSHSFYTLPRFTGLYGKPGGMAAAAGLLVGLSLFTNLSLMSRLIGLTAAGPCLYLTGARTFWAATLAAGVITALFYMKNKRVIIGMSSIMLVALGILIFSGKEVRVPSPSETAVLRAESLENMSGRTTLWMMALDRFWQRPWFGHGYTMGHHAFLSRSVGRSNEYGGQPDVLQHETFTLHNGYIQALLDSGAIGTALYLGVIGLALWRIILHDKTRDYGVVMYALLFFSISNGGETVIFSAATFHAVFFWYVAVLALSLPHRHQTASSILPLANVHSDKYAVAFKTI